jgi:hypothetical protein
MNYYRWFGGNRTKLANGQPVYDGNLAETGGSGGSGALNQCGGSLPAADPQRVTNVIPNRGTPYFAINSQWDSPSNPPPPSSTYRLWDVTGGDHVDRQMYDHLYPVFADLDQAGVGGPHPLPWFGPNAAFPPCRDIAPGCFRPEGWYTDDATRPEVGLPQLELRAYQLLKDWTEKGQEPPTPPYMTRTQPGGPLVLGADGNALGGLRMPAIQAPIAKYIGGFFGDSTEVHIPFSRERLSELYPTHKDYVKQFKTAAHELHSDGYLTPGDTNDLIKAAEDRPIPTP